jgi:hypothetical protein
VALLGDGELAVTKGVPELDGAVAGTGDNLSVVGREGDGQNIVGVSDETAGGGAGGELPETEGLVPGGRESVSTVRGDNLIYLLVVVIFRFVEPLELNVRSRRRCGSDRGESALGIRRRSHHGSGSR